MIIKCLNTEKTVIKKVYEFDEVFNIFDEIDNKRNRKKVIKKKLKTYQACHY